MFHLNTIKQLIHFVDHLEVCLPHSRLLTGIPLLVVFKNLRWNSNIKHLYTLLESLIFTISSTKTEDVLETEILITCQPAFYCKENFCFSE